MKNRNLKQKVNKTAVKTVKYFDMYEKKETPLEALRRIREGNEKNKPLSISFANLATDTNAKAVALVMSVRNVGFTFKMKRDGLRFDVVKI